jgi:hypothetical protein
MGVYHKVRKVYAKNLAEEISKIKKLRMEIAILNKRINIANKELKE